MPAKPRPPPAVRRELPARAGAREDRPDRLVGDFRAAARDRLERDLIARDFAGRDLLELERAADFFEADR